MSIDRADALHRRVRAMMGETAIDRDAFDAMARDLAIHQHDSNAGYARLCVARHRDPHRDAPSSLPAVPTDAFRLTRIATHPPELDVAVFRTSGTTHGTRGAHPMRTLDTYRLASTRWAAQMLFRTYGARPRVLALSPNVDEMPDSSLVRMMRWLIDDHGAEHSRFLDPRALDAALAALGTTSNEPVVVLATAFALVHLLDHASTRTRAIPLPPQSRIMLTGGFKGRSRELSEVELRGSLSRAFAIPRRDVVGEYGMTELTSQLWAIPETDDAPLRYRPPPWMRVIACDPVMLTPLPSGARGIARFEDLGNVESAWAVQTSDDIIVDEDGLVTLLGRTPGATPRGCSIAIDELLGGGAR